MLNKVLEPVQDRPQKSQACYNCVITLRCGQTAALCSLPTSLSFKTALIWIQRLKTESCSFPHQCWHTMSRKYVKPDEQMILGGGCTLGIPACDRLQQVLIRAEIISLSSLLYFILNHNFQHHWELGCLALHIRKTNVHYHISWCVVDSVKVWRGWSEFWCIFLTLPAGGVLCFFFSWEFKIKRVAL